ncbi:MAG: hypothetical protein OHK0012_19030 [Synechococcales cyanobacterium]
MTFQMAVDAHGMPVKVVMTEGTRADCQQACRLMDGIKITHVLANRAEEHEAIAVIPPKRNRREQREYGEYLDTLRHLVENAFLHLKQWRGIVTR